MALCLQPPTSQPLARFVSALSLSPTTMRKKRMLFVYPNRCAYKSFSNFRHGSESVYINDMKMPTFYAEAILSLQFSQWQLMCLHCLKQLKKTSTLRCTRPNWCCQFARLNKSFLTISKEYSATLKGVQRASRCHLVLSRPFILSWEYILEDIHTHDFFVYLSNQSTSSHVIRVQSKQTKHEKTKRKKETLRGLIL